MALSKKNKGGPPKELPDLALDELKKEMNNALSQTEEKKEESAPPQQEETPVENQTQQEETPVENQTQQEEPPQQETVEETPVENPDQQEESNGETENEEPQELNLDPNKSFFNSILMELEHKEADISKLNQWYKSKFPQGNALEEMKEFWKEKKEEIILENIGKDLKAKIDLHMKQLQKLEGEWQKIYFDLITKEDEMKNQEKKLKEVINEFTEVFKKRGNIKKGKKERISNEKKEKAD